MDVERERGRIDGCREGGGGIEEKRARGIEDTRDILTFLLCHHTMLYHVC